MDVIQTNWRGRLLNYKKDGSGIYVAMTGSDSLLYFPVIVEANALYRITLEIRNDSGNGVIYCNIFGNQNFDFPHTRICCDSTEWKTYDADVQTKTFPKTLPFIFRMWRKPEGSGSLSVRRIVVEMIGGEPRVSLTTNNKSKPELSVVQSQPRQLEAATQVMRGRIPVVDKEILKNYVKMLNFDGDSRRKVLYLPLNSNVIQQTGMEEAFVDCGFSVCSFDYLRYHEKTRGPVDLDLKNLVKMVRPDWIHIQLQFCDFLSSNTVDDIKKSYPSTLITTWTGDIRESIDSSFASFVPVVDYSLVSNMAELPRYRCAGNGKGNVEYWQIGYDPKFFSRASDETRKLLHQSYKHDVCLCANYVSWFPGSKERWAIAAALQKKLGSRFVLYGKLWPRNAPQPKCQLNFFEQQKAYNGSKIVISVNNFNDAEMYFSDRQLITMASGTATLSRYIPGLERYFQNNKHTAWFNTTAECVDLVDYYLNNPEKAEELGKAGADIMMREHTYGCRVKELCSRFGISGSIEKQSAQPLPTQLSAETSTTHEVRTMDTPDISIVLGTYNRLSVLKNTVTRVLESGSGISLEMVINDGGSNDGTKEWLQDISKSDERIRPIFSNSLEGITASYNRGFRAAKGKFVIWLSDDTVPIGSAIADLVKFMGGLGPKDMAALPVRHVIRDFVTPNINKILCPTVGCICRDTLEKMEYWNMDYPHYAQDIEFSARVWRLGGRILECHGAKIDHLNVRDWLRGQNTQKYIDDGQQDKFEVMCKNNFGQKSHFMYPAILVCSDISVQSAVRYVSNIKANFRNVVIHAIDCPMLLELHKVCGVLEIVPETDTHKYDFLLTNDGLCDRITRRPIISPYLAKLK